MKSTNKKDLGKHEQLITLLKDKGWRESPFDDFLSMYPPNNLEAVRDGYWIDIIKNTNRPDYNKFIISATIKIAHIYGLFQGSERKRKIMTMEVEKVGIESIIFTKLFEEVIQL